MSGPVQWTPAAIFAVGIVLHLGVVGRDAGAVTLNGELAAAVPAELLGLGSRDLRLAEWEEKEAGVDDYLLRSFEPLSDGQAEGLGENTAAAAGLGLYVGFHASNGRTVHSPRNCLPGSGWEVLSAGEEVVMVPGAGGLPVNRHLIRKGEEQAVVLYWYQGRGQVRANEFRAKLDLLRDGVLRGRSDEVIVRIVTPVRTSEADAFTLAAAAAAEVIPALFTVLPE